MRIIAVGAIHMDGHYLQAVKEIGIAGSSTTPFDTSSEFTEDTIGSIASNAISQARQLTEQQQRVEKNRIPLMLVSHAPPYQTSVDRLTDGSCVGSVAVRACIERESPDLCICGHIPSSGWIGYNRYDTGLQPGDM